VGSAGGITTLGRLYERRGRIDEAEEAYHRRIPTAALNRVLRDAQLLSKLSAAVICSDMDGIVTYWNEAATRLYGYSAEERLGKLAIFEGVREFPVRVKCATLPWHTLHAALANERTKVTTE